VLPVSEGMFGNCYFLWAGDSARITVPAFPMPDTAFVLEFYFRPSSSLDTAGDSAGIASMENGPVSVFYRDGTFEVRFYCDSDTIIYAEKMHFPASKWTLITIAANDAIKDVLVNRLHKFYFYREQTPIRWKADCVVRFGQADVDGRSLHFSGRLDEARLLNTARYW